MASVEYTCDGTFEGNILVVGQTGCGKTTFIQKLAKNNLFCELRKYFGYQKYRFLQKKKKIHRPVFKNKYILNILRQLMILTWSWNFSKKKNLVNDVDIVMAESNIYNKLIVMDDVLGLANKSNDFANFLTVSRKFNFTCAYVFHTICLTGSNWQMILSQTKSFNIFPASLQTSSVVKILPSYCSRYTYEYILHRDLWLNRLYFEISN